MSFSPWRNFYDVCAVWNWPSYRQEIKKISEKIYYFTGGHPFLISYICKTIDEKLDKDWSLERAIKAATSVMKNESELRRYLSWLRRDESSNILCGSDFREEVVKYHVLSWRSARWLWSMIRSWLSRADKKPVMNCSHYELRPLNGGHLYP